MLKTSSIRYGVWLAIFWSLATVSAEAQVAKGLTADRAGIAEYWTSERRAAAIPRDLVIDPRGLGYLKVRDGVLVPHGHKVAFDGPVQTSTPAPTAKPGGGGGGTGDATPPVVRDMDPGTDTTIGASYTFSANVTDASGIRSVAFKIAKNGSRTQSFLANNTGGGIWSVGLQGFTDGDWTWYVVAKDKAGNTTTSSSVGFKVSTSGSGGGSGDVIANAHWSGGDVQKAAGRLYFEMPYKGGWAGFVCSGTVATDGTIGRSLIMTAAHCVYDDVNKVFARRVMFIPEQDDGGTDKTDLTCSNDPMGCWLPSFGVVDSNWATLTFPENIAWDYAFYVVSDTGAHEGTAVSSTALDDNETAGSLPVSFDPVQHDTPDSSDYTHALGYSYAYDPNFMYCAEDMTTEGAADWWLAHCGLSGGASGGPWVQPMDIASGSGPIISVNSWGYVDRFGNSLPGMAGAKLFGTSASCVYDAAKGQAFPATTPADGLEGTVVTCPSPP